MNIHRCIVAFIGMSITTPCRHYKKGARQAPKLLQWQGWVGSEYVLQAAPACDPEQIVQNTYVC